MVKEEMPLMGENDEQDGAGERNGQNSQVYIFTLLAAGDTCRRCGDVGRHGDPATAV